MTLHETLLQITRDQSQFNQSVESIRAFENSEISSEEFQTELNLINGNECEICGSLSHSMSVHNSELFGY